MERALQLVIFALFTAVIILSFIAASELDKKKELERDTFFSDRKFEKYSVYCNETNELAVETYCRLLRIGAQITHSEEEADIIVYVNKEILYVTNNSKEEVFLNLPIGEQYIQTTNAEYLFHMHKFVSEFPPNSFK